EDSRTTGTRAPLLPALVIAQVGLSLVLLSGAGLFMRTFQNLRHLDPGFMTEGVLLFEFKDRKAPIPAGVFEEVQRLPGVIAASYSTHTPLNGSTWSDPVVPAGQPLPEADNAVFVGAGPHFFATMRIQILAGREFSDADRADGQPVAIVNE